MSCPCFVMCYVGYVCEIGQADIQRGSVCYSYCCGYHGNAGNSVCLLSFYYKSYTLFHTYDDTYLDANTHPAFQVPAVCVILAFLGVRGPLGNKVVAMAP